MRAVRRNRRTRISHAEREARQHLFGLVMLLVLVCGFGLFIP